VNRREGRQGGSSGVFEREGSGVQVVTGH
jgi:hypothetical protein